MRFLDTELKEQVRSLFGPLSSQYTFRIRANHQEKGRDLMDFVQEFVSCSDHLSYEVVGPECSALEFTLARNGEDTGIAFRGIPIGHEFSSLLLAVLNADGKGKNLPDKTLIRRIEALEGPIRLQTYVSLTCNNCPDVVQALNLVCLYNPQVTHEMIDGALFPEEIELLGIQAVPSVFANGELIQTGRGTLYELLGKLEERFGSEVRSDYPPDVHTYDVLVLGGGPAGVSAAIYSARKGMKVAVVAERIGGQIKETVAIENLISVPKTSGAQLADDLRRHMDAYPVTVYENRWVEKVNLDGEMKRVEVHGGESFEAPALILATGASWRKLEVGGESEYVGKGVAYCSHCDGPLFQGKRVAVAGGGNSGIEAALDLARICSSVTVIEFADQLKADQILIEKLLHQSNVEILTHYQIMEILGNGEHVTGVRVLNRKTLEQQEISLDGVFIQIGLAANSMLFKGELELTARGEIIIDRFCRTPKSGVYAAGDVTDVPYKQIVIAMGEGAKAALSAFEDRIRGTIGT